MTRIIFYALLLLALVGLASCGGGEEPAPRPQPGEGAVVSIKNFAFDPATLTVDRGTTVAWINEDSAPHTVTGQGFDSGTLGKSGTFSITFDEPKSYAYLCTIHPYMTGKVEVK